MQVRTRLVLLLHASETKKPTNTGSLAVLALSNSEVHVRGVKDSPTSLDHLRAPERRVVVLYPSDTAVVLTPEWVAADSRAVTLVVPDGSWRQASKMPRREPALRDMPCVKLEGPSTPAALLLRREHTPHGMATLLAIAAAYAVLEGDEVGRSLRALYRLVAERTLQSRGTLAITQ